MSRVGRLPRTHVTALAAVLLVLALAPGAAALGTVDSGGDVGHVSTHADAAAESTADGVTLSAGAVVEAAAGGREERVSARESTGEVPLPAGAATLLPSLDHEVSPELSSPASAPVDASAGATARVGHDPGSSGGDATTQGTVLVPQDPAWQEEAAVVTGVLTLAGLVALFGSSLKALLAQGVAAVVPMFSRLSRSEVLDNGTRAAIYEAIRDDPGLCASEVSERVGAAWGTTVYHLKVLVDHHFVTTMKHGRHRRYFENGGTHSGREELLATLRNDTTAEVLDTVQNEPGLPQKEIADRVDLSPQALAWHLKRLTEVDLVTKERDGRVVRHFVTEQAPIPV